MPNEVTSKFLFMEIGKQHSAVHRPKISLFYLPNIISGARALLFALVFCSTSSRLHSSAVVYSSAYIHTHLQVHVNYL